VSAADRRWRLALTILALVNLAVIALSWTVWACGSLASLNVIGELALIGAITGRPRMLW